MTVHDIKKHGFVTSTTPHRLREFLSLAAAYDVHGVYTLIEDSTSIKYEKIIETDTINLSFKPINNNKLIDIISSNGSYEQIKHEKGVIAKTAQSGYESGSTTFADLGVLLTGDFAYSPFLYRDGTRGRENVISGTKILVFDIDKSVITAEEAHFMLSDINHHIALGSDPSNNFKFRVIIELDSVVTLDPLTWTYFYNEVANELALTIDALPQSQIFYSYRTSPVLSVTDGATFHVRDCVMEAVKKSQEKPKLSTYNTKEKEALIADKLTTFGQAFDAKHGEGSRKLIWAAKLAHYDLGMSIEDTVDLIQEISDYWHNPMSPERLEATILSQIRRWS
jgi:hypothetical protein